MVTMHIRASVSLDTSELIAKQVNAIIHLEENDIVSDGYCLGMHVSIFVPLRY